MLITSMWLVDLLLVFITFIFHKYWSRKYDYWQKKGIFYHKPIPFLGSIYPVISFNATSGIWLRDLYNSTKAQYFGIFVFDQPYLIIRSPEVIRNVLIKDFNYFYDRTIVASKHNKLFENAMFIQKNPYWKIERPKLSPLFSPAKLKAMFPLIHDTGLDMNKYIRKNMGLLEAKEICSKFSTNVIAKCAFAINAHCFEKDDADFRKIGKSFFDFTWRNAIAQSSYFFMPGLVNLFHLELVEISTTNYLKKIFWDAILLREKTNVKRNDLIDVVVDIRKNKEFCKQIKFEGDKVVSHAVQYFAAGFETTSSTIAFTLYELCLQPQIQDKLRDEIINNIKEHSGITYDGLQKLKYLEMCIKETLRKYPALPFLDRRCNSDYIVPGTDFVIEKGTAILIPMMGLHYDEEYYPEPQKYDPERFNDKHSYNINGINYVPFGVGPRGCIGERFGMLASKLALVSILSEFVIERTLTTPVTLEFEPKCFVLTSKVGLPIKFRKIGSTEA